MSVSELRRFLVDERMDVVVKQIKKEGRSPFLSLRCAVLNGDRPFDANILVNLQNVDNKVNVSIGSQLMICAPWHEIDLTSETSAYICPFILPRRT